MRWRYLLEVCVSTVEFEMLRAFDQTSAVLDDFLQADTGPGGSSNRTLCPRSVDHFVTFTRIFVDLLDASSTRTLDGCQSRLTGEQVLVLQVSQLEGRRSFHEPTKVNRVFGGRDDRDPTMIAYKVERIRCDGFFCHETLEVDQMSVGPSTAVEEGGKTLPSVAHRCTETSGDVTCRDAFPQSPWTSFLPESWSKRRLRLCAT